MTPVDQNAPVMEMSAWSAGFFVLAAAATMGAVPSPDSLENRPRAQPNCRGHHHAGTHRAAESRLSA